MIVHDDHARVFFDGGARYVVVRAFHAAEGAAEGRALLAHEARWVLSRLLGPGREGEIAGAYRALVRGALPSSDRADLDRMRDALIEAADRGHLLVFELGLVGSSTHREVEDGPAAKGPAAPPREEKTWVGILLVDDSDPPEPVAYARYRVELPDGSTREGILDQDGRARIDGIDPGSCKISFPGYDHRDWS